MPPSLAWTIRSNPGQAEGRKAVDTGRSFKGMTGSRVEAPPDGGERYYACFAARHHKTACRKCFLLQSIMRRSLTDAPIKLEYGVSDPVEPVIQRWSDLFKLRSVQGERHGSMRERHVALVPVPKQKILRAGLAPTTSNHSNPSDNRPCCHIERAQSQTPCHARLSLDNDHRAECISRLSASNISFVTFAIWTVNSRNHIQISLTYVDLRSCCSYFSTTLVIVVLPSPCHQSATANRENQP